jgi:uncharacterized protein (DUF2236 family)
MQLPHARARAAVRRQLEEFGGRHDEVAIYGGEPGDPGLAGGPGSISWEVNGDLASVAAAGIAAILMEVLHPSVMAGVYEQSSYRTQPLRRAQNTLGYVLRTTFGSTPAATDIIERVKRVHSRVNGVRPDGVPYAALDPELIAWVHTCIPWAVMEAFSRYRRPLSTVERDRYLAEQAVIGRMGGATEVPSSMAELEAYVERMRPLLAMTEQTRGFLGFLAGDTLADPISAADPEVPPPAPGREQLDRRLAIAASMSLMPVWARQISGTYLPNTVVRRVLVPRARLECAVIRWALPTLPCVELAHDRATGVAAATSAVAC